jgi:hypothetical protein
VVKSIKAPLMLMQPADDYSLGPSQTLGPLIDVKGFPDRHFVFPNEGDPSNPATAHGPFINDPGNWGGDVLAYLADCGEVTKTPIVAQNAGPSGQQGAVGASPTAAPAQ